MNEIQTRQEMLQPVVTSHSIDALFEFCPRKFEFAHVWTMHQEGGNTGFAAEVGTALHEAVQAWAKLALFPGRTQTRGNEMAIEAGLKMLLKWWPWSLERASLIAGKNGIKQRSLGEAILLFEEIIYNPFWDSWELIWIDDNFGLSIEVPYRINHAKFGTFALPNGKLGYLVTQGKIDFILRHRYTGEIRVFDLKTTVKDERAHAAAFKFSGQVVNYGIVVAAGLNINWREQPLQVSYLVSNFASADGSEDPSVRIYTYQYKQPMLEDMILVKHERMEQMVKYARRRHWPRRTHGCDSFGSACQYFGICQSRDDDLIRAWFAFESFEASTRIYEPIWNLIDD